MSPEIGLAALFLLCAVSHAAASTGCGSAPPAAGRLTFTHESVEREMYLHLPPNYDQSAASPVAFAFHGWGGTGDDFTDADTTAAADEHGLIVISPTGIQDSWNFRGSSTGLSPDGPICDIEKKKAAGKDDCNAPCDCANLNVCVWTNCGDDVAFFKALLIHVQDLLCIDSTQVFAWGVSNGGMFTWELGQNAETAGLLSAIAPVVGLPHRGYNDGKGSAAPLPVLLLTGLTDDLVLPGGDEAFLESPNSHDYHVTASAITKRWALDSQCDVSGTPQRLMVPGVDASQTVCTSFCHGGFPQVVDCRFDGGHILPTWGPNAIFAFFVRQPPTPMLAASDPRVVYTGRVLVPDAPNLPARFAWPLTQMACSFRGVAITADLKGPAEGGARMRVMVDGIFTRYIEVHKNTRDVFVLASGLEDADHVVSLWKVTEDDPFSDDKTLAGDMEFRGFQLPSGGTFNAAPPRPSRKIEIVGDSDVTWGLGNKQCVDTEGWADKDGDSCSTVAKGDSGLGWCQNSVAYAVNGVGAYEACCGCGGGSLSVSTCTGIPGFKDSDGDSCATIVGAGNCKAAAEYAVNGVDANQACCGCRLVRDAVGSWAGELGILTGAELMVEAIGGTGVTDSAYNNIFPTMDNTLTFDPTHKWDSTQWTPDAIVLLIGPNDDSSTVEFATAYSKMLNDRATAYAAAATKPKLINICGGSGNGWVTCEHVKVASDKFNADAAHPGFVSYYLSMTHENWKMMNENGSPSKYTEADAHYNMAGVNVLLGDILAPMQEIMGWSSTSAPTTGVLDDTCEQDALCHSDTDCDVGHCAAPSRRTLLFSSLPPLSRHCVCGH